MLRYKHAMHIVGYTSQYTSHYIPSYIMSKKAVISQVLLLEAYCCLAT